MFQKPKFRKARLHKFVDFPDLRFALRIPAPILYFSSKMNIPRPRKTWMFSIDSHLGSFQLLLRRLLAAMDPINRLSMIVGF